MNPVQMISGIIFLALGIGAFAIGYLQFKGKGYLFNNAYFWASKEERKQMDKNKESKKPYYRQSSVSFMLIGIIFLIYAIYIIIQWTWMLAALVLTIIIAVVYAVVSSVQNERYK